MGCSLEKKIREMLNVSERTRTSYMVIDETLKELGKVAQRMREDKKRDVNKRWEQFKEQNNLSKRKMKDVEFYAFNVGYELAKKEDLKALVGDSE